MAKQVEEKECENPNCSAKFIPYNSRQRVCRRESCKVWLERESGYKLRRYKLRNHPEIPPFTREDLIKVE
jgi:hypothetical protein